MERFMQTRRAVLCQALKLSAGLAIGSKELLGQTAERAWLLAMGSQARTKVPGNFTGLGYEMSSVAPLGLLSPGNRGYFNLLRGLGNEGVLRVGGIVANYTRYQAD